MKVFLRPKRIFCSNRVKKIDYTMKDLSYFERIIFLTSCCFALLLLIACTGPYISLQKFPFLYIFGLGTPFLVVTNLVFGLYWLWLKKRLYLLSLFALIIGYFTIGNFLMIFNGTSTNKPNDIRILTYNVHSFRGINWSNHSFFTKDILTFVSEQNADIVCFQEYDQFLAESDTVALTPYKFRYHSSNNEEGEYHLGQAIYSKYPIIGKGSINFPNSVNNAIYADILKGRDTMRVYNVHLQSLNVRPGSIKREPTYGLFKRLGETFRRQEQQLELILAHAKKTNAKIVIVGDLNNTQFSNLYRRLKGNLKDSFIEKGLGIGRTYDFFHIPFRIDFILIDPAYEVTSHKNYDIKLSDHYPIMASFRLSSD